jgi:hypothetical protein
MRKMTFLSGSCVMDAAPVLMYRQDTFHASQHPRLASKQKSTFLAVGVVL